MADPSDQLSYEGPNGPVGITPISIEGIHQLPARRNVQKWFAGALAKGEELLQLTLFVEAMKVFQAGDTTDQLSYFRVAGIHGFPHNVSWNMDKPPIPRDAPDLQALLNEKKGGWYCPHNRLVFPTWHRAYMMLFERRLSDLMIAAAAAKPGDDNAKKAWMLAARTWRLPYWDWALDSSLPDLVTKPRIDVVEALVDGVPKTVEVDNPMYSFRMPGGDAMGSEKYGDYRIDSESGNPWSLCKGTSRYGISWTDEQRGWVAGVSNATTANAVLNGEYPSDPKAYNPPRTIQEAVQRLMNPGYSKTYELFATTKFNKSFPVGHLSLESIHNNIHNMTGGSDGMQGIGHMCSIPVAAFDPVFWLHHSNVDRLTWLWQLSHQDTWLRPTPVDPDAPEDREKADANGDCATSALTPFRPKPALDSWYSSDDMRYIEPLNYTYDDFQKMPGGRLKGNDGLDRVDDPYVGAPMRDDSIAKHINHLYGVGTKTEEENARPQLFAALSLDEGQVDPVISIVYNRYALGGVPYTIYFFLGDLKPGVPFSRQPSLVGRMHTFSSPYSAADSGATCSNCRLQASSGTLSGAEVPIQRAIDFDGLGISGDRDALERHLVKDLRWVAALNNGTKIPAKSLPDLRITVRIGNAVRPADPAEWTAYNDFGDTTWSQEVAEL